MISRSTLLFAVALVAVFGASAYAGYWYRSRQAVDQVLAQDGWCCMLERRECVVTTGMDACEASGGASFNWDRSACDAACSPPVRRGTRRRPGAAPTTSSP